MPYFPPPSSGSGMAIGGAVAGGTAGDIPYIDAGSNLAQSASLAFDATDGQLVLAAGSAAKPALSLVDDGLGLFRQAVNVLGFATAATERWRITAAGVLQPATDGAYDIGAAGGLRPRDVFLQSRLLTGVGSAANPAWSFDSDPTNGIYRPAANQVGIATNGVGRWLVDASGHLLAVTDASFDIGASGATRPRSIYTSGNITMGGTMVIGSLLATLQTRGANNRTGLEAVSGMYCYLMGNLGASTATSATEADVVLGADANRTAGFVLSVNNNMTTGGAGSRLMGVTFDGRIIALAPNSAATDSDLPNGSWTAYLNEAGNTLTFKAKYSGGTVKTGTVALT